MTNNNIYSLKCMLKSAEKGYPAAHSDYIEVLKESIRLIEYHKAEAKKWKSLSKLSHATIVILAVVFAVAFLIFG